MGGKEKSVYRARGNGKRIRVDKAVGEENCHLNRTVNEGEVNHHLYGVVGKAVGNFTGDRAITGKRGRANRIALVAITDLAISASKRGKCAENLLAPASSSKANERGPVDPQLYKDCIGSKIRVYKNRTYSKAK